MANRNSASCFYNIFNYWKDKCITEQGDVLIDYGYIGCDRVLLDDVNSISVVEDWGEPSCFACGATMNYSEIPDYDTLVSGDGSDLKRIWNSRAVASSFQKAHIIPKALGGNYEADNMFCLCTRCHRDSPDTKYPKMFFRYVYSRRNEGHIGYRVIEAATKECVQLNVLPLFVYGDDTKLDKEIGSHGGFVSESSLVAALVGKAVERTSALRGLSYNGCAFEEV